MLEGTCECGYALVCSQIRKYMLRLRELKMRGERHLHHYSAGGSKSRALNGAGEFSELIRSQR
jgi:hypothetical protein